MEELKEEGHFCPEGHRVDAGAVVCPECLALVHGPGGPVWTPNDR
ncbi:MAG TPA: hypothetical protein VFH58_15840 [Acidimicrobiales bacterium]|nr:hypothetical protein [Acidimicrobiales bacterium]